MINAIRLLKTEDLGEFIRFVEPCAGAKLKEYQRELLSRLAQGEKITLSHEKRKCRTHTQSIPKKALK